MMNQLHVSVQDVQIDRTSSSRSHHGSTLLLPLGGKLRKHYYVTCSALASSLQFNTMKRRRSSSLQAELSAGGVSSRLFALDELFLRVLSFLDARELARVQSVSRRWGRMSLDPQLWKRLYLEQYPHPHRPKLVYTRSRSATPLRPIARLPSRAFPPQSVSPSPDEPSRVRNDGVDWKIMMRLGTNWANGNVLAEATVPLSQPPTSNEYSQHHIALFPSFICTCSPSSPLVHVYNSNGGESLGIIPPPPGWSSPARPDIVTALCADQAVEPYAGGTVPARLAIMYASGGFVIARLRVAEGRLEWTRESVCNTRSRPRRRQSSHAQAEDDRVVFAAMHYPSLVTCTRRFLLSFYSLAGGKQQLIGALHSDVSFHPASLALFPDQLGGSTFRAALTYCTPVYPTSWTISIQEISIDINNADISSGECYRVTTGLDKDRWPRRVQPLVGIRGKAIGVGTDGRWCVLAGDDSVIHVYSLPETREEPDMAHVQTLLAPSSGVTSLALTAGRCVTGGKDGRVLVWELDDSLETEDGEARVGRVAEYVEVKPGARRRPPSPSPSDHDMSADLPHPSAISSAARSMFLATPPAALKPSTPCTEVGAVDVHGQATTAIRELAFDEEKIVGLVDGPGGDVMRVWSFS